MGNSLWTKHMRGTARAGVLAVLVAAPLMPGSAKAQDDDDKTSIWNLDKRILNGFAKGLGLVKGGDPSIDYRERSPLVVPPTRDLPPPQSEPKRSAEWPVDPDSRRREDAASRKKIDRRRSYDEDYENRSLMPSELNRPGAAQASSTPRKPDKVDISDGEGGNMKPSELGYIGGLFSWSAFGFGQSEESGKFTKEPPRRSLTEPPVGYQTPSSEQPYGIGKQAPARRSVTPLDPAVGDLGN
jgi:hypothetical protein